MTRKQARAQADSFLELIAKGHRTMFRDAKDADLDIYWHKRKLVETAFRAREKLATIILTGVER